MEPRRKTLHFPLEQNIAGLQRMLELNARITGQGIRSSCCMDYSAPWKIWAESPAS